MGDTSIPTMSASLTELMFKALDHAIESVRASGGPLTPFLMTYEGPEPSKHLKRFVAGTLEGSIEEARKHAALAGDHMQCCALAYDGFLTMEGKRSDSITVEVMERGQETSLVVAQRYQTAKWYRRFKTIGNTVFLGDGPRLF